MKPTSAPTSPFAAAQWIWPDSHCWDLHNGYALFRRACTLARVQARAPLFITADQSYQLYVNGHYVCRGPARGFQTHWPYDAVDVARWLRPGGNVLAVRAHHPGFSNFQYLSQGYAGLLVAARWGGVRVVSDGSWRCRRQSGVRRDTVPTSLQLFCQEHTDLREEDPAWMQPDHDDSGWNAPVAARPWNAPPWFALEERGLPLLDESSYPAAPVLVGRGAGRCAAGYALTRDAARLRHGEGLSHAPAREETGEAIHVEPTGRGRFRSYLLDYGRTVVGSLGLEIDGAAGGEIVDTLHVETVDAATLTPDFVPGEHCRMAFAHRLVCRPGGQAHDFYHAFGFRYVVVTVRDATAGLRLRPRLRTAFYPLEARGGFRCPDAPLQGIWDTCAWTQRVCSLDAYVDTPWREQAQWWGDARVQAKNTFFLSGDTRLLRRGIAQIAGQSTPDGLTYGHAPTMAHNCVLPDFSLIWLLTLWDYYWQTGSTEPFLQHRETVEKILGYFEAMTDPQKGLARYDPRYWLFLDWTELHRTGLPSVLNLWLLLALDRAAQLHRLTADRPAAARLERRAARLRRALGAALGPDGLLRDGYDERGRLVPAASIHSQVLASMAGLPGLAEERVVADLLLPYLRGESRPAAEPSAYWVTYVLERAREAGHGRAVIDFIRRRWSPMAAHGTTWENYAPARANESFSHAWSAHPLYHLVQTAGGIVQTAPAWREIRFEPCFALDACEAHVPAPPGTIRSAWRREGGGVVSVQLQLPRGVTAEVRLPGVPRQRVGKSARWKLRLEQDAAG